MERYENAVVLNTEDDVIKDLAARLTASRNANAAIIEDHSRLKVECDSLRNKVKVLSLRVEALEALLGDTQEQLADANERLRKLDDEIEKAKEY